MKKVAIINYGLGNTYSIQNALNHIGSPSDLVSDPDKLKGYSHVILPGVGAFPYAMSILKTNCMDAALVDYAREGRPLLGICLGMQLLFSESDENEIMPGLNLLPGRVKRFEPRDSYTIPQIQWNRINFLGRSNIINNISNADYFYFLHSYCVEKTQENSTSLIGLTTYAEQDYVSFIQSDNVVGAQFHPEKSGETGLKLLRNFIDI
jgi:glutamine amidotransferase